MPQIKLEEKDQPNSYLDNQKIPRKKFWNWDIHYACNYRCSYCFLAGKWEKAASENRYPGVKRWVDVWNRIYNKYGTCHIHFSGGEPFVYPDFLDLIVPLLEKHTLQFSTNLSFDIAHFIAKVDSAKVRLDASFHPEFANFEEFLEKVLRLKENDFQIQISYVAYPPHLKEMEIFKAENEIRKIKFIIQPFRGEYRQKVYPNSYTESEKDMIRSCGKNFSTNKIQLNYHLKEKQKEKKLCYMGQVYGKIYASADVYRCCSTGSEKLGNLLDDEDFSLLNEPMPCEIEDCLCWRRMVVGEEDRWLGHWNL